MDAALTHTTSPTKRALGMTSLDLGVTGSIVRARDCLLEGTGNPPPTQQPDPLLGSAP